MQVELRLPSLATDQASGTHLGYTSFARNVQQALLQAGIEVTASAPISLYLGPPHLFSPTPGKRSVLYTMWEVEPIPADIVQPLTQADVLIVPSQYCATIFRRAGVRQPIHVIPLGIWPDEWPTTVVTRAPGEPLKFLWVNARSARKGSQFLRRAWYETFTLKDRVQLTIKTSYDPGDMPIPNLRYGGVHVITEKLHWEALKSLYWQHHVFLCTSTCEGFGLTPLEAMASGLLVISPRHTGLAEYIHKGVAWVCETDRVGMRYEEAAQLRITTRAPKVSHLKALMRQAVRRFDETTDFRAQAQQYAKTFSWDRTAREVMQVLARETERQVA